MLGCREPTGKLTMVLEDRGHNILRIKEAEKMSNCVNVSGMGSGYGKTTQDLIACAVD